MTPTHVHLANLDLADRVRLGRITQREALRKAHPRDVLQALLSPTPELASYKLAQLFLNHRGALVPRFGRRRLERLYVRFNRRLGWDLLSDEVRLRDLSLESRRMLVEELLAIAPMAWKERLR